MKYRCNQCWHKLSRDSFATHKNGKRYANCKACRAKYNGWANLSLAQKLERVGRRKNDAPVGWVRFVRRSGNVKLGPIPVSITERGTCPPECMFFEMGCYADAGTLGSHWNRVPEDGLPWDEFLERIAALPEGTLWRHAEAGDLPGERNELDVLALRELAEANRGRRGFTYTHKPLRTVEERNAVFFANAKGFVINLSADSIDEADERLDEYVGPVVVTVAKDAKIPKRSPRGRKLVPCPAQTHGMTCVECRLCAVPRRRSIVVFRGHGQGANLIPELVRAKRAKTVGLSSTTQKSNAAKPLKQKEQTE